MEAQIISIGTELTAGLTVDTNAAWLSGRLAALGITVGHHATIGDRIPAICDAISEAARRSRLVLVTGGLGPTPDDVTREALAAAVEQPLTTDPAALEHVRTYFAKIGRPMAKSNERQALLPRGAKSLSNTCGTAPGIRATLGESVIYAFPGVPSEMRAMFAEAVEPELAGFGGGTAIARHAVHCIGASESALAEKIADLMEPDREPHVGITAHDGIISIRITAHGADAEAADRAARCEAGVIRDRIGSQVFGGGDETLEQVVGELLMKAGATVSTAESCTGGLLAKFLTDVAGSSAYFPGGTVTYADEAKISQLAVSSELIGRYGAVSEEVAEAMANGCRQTFEADLGLSCTGIAGPSGGSSEKPVGLVYIGLADGDGCQVRRCLFPSSWDRQMIRDRACKAALNLLRLRLVARGR